MLGMPCLLDTKGHAKFHMFAHLTHGQSIAADDGCGVDFVADQFICSFEELSRYNYHRGRAIPHFLILQLC